MPAVTEQKKNLKEEILRVAETMFCQYGYDATTFQKIADELHITKGSITYHFKNKHFIMGTLFEEYFALLRAKCQARARGSLSARCAASARHSGAARPTRRRPAAGASKR